MPTAPQRPRPRAWTREVAQSGIEGILSTPVRVLLAVDDEYLHDGAPANVLARRLLVVDHHVGGECVERHRVGVDDHRIGRADGLQVHSRLAGDMELVEEADEVALRAASARVGGRLVGEVDLTNKVSEVAHRAGDLPVVQCVKADAVGRAGLASLARNEQGSRPEQISGRWCTSPHGGRQMSGVGCDICQWMAYHGGSE